MFDTKYQLTMYLWGVPLTVSYNVYFWVMRGETREQRFKRALKVYFKHKKEGKLCQKSTTSGCLRGCV